MDDIYVIGEPSKLYSLNIEIQERIRQTKMELNASKSRLQPVPDFQQEFEFEGKLEVPYVRAIGAQGYDGEPVYDVDTDYLLNLESQILEAPERFGRPAFRFVLRNLRELQQFEGAWKWLEIIHLLPEHVDILGRYFRDAAHFSGSPIAWQDLAEWFSSYANSSWAQLPWVRGQLSLIFDSGRAGSRDLKPILQDWLEKETDLQLLAVAIQRLAVADPGAVRDIARGRIDGISSPLLQRLFALGLMSANEEKHLVDKLLGRDPRNILLRDMLRHRGHKVPEVEGDFDSPIEDG